MKIVYVNTFNYSFFLKQRPHHLLESLAKRGHQIYWVDFDKRNYYSDKINDNLTVYYDWDRFLREFKGEIDILYTTWSMRYQDIDQLQPKITIYDCLDKFEINEPYEEIMLKKANVVLTTTSRLLEEYKRYNSNIYLCPNGCFTELGTLSYSIPNDLKDLPKPWILFSGALTDSSVEGGWCDLDLIEKVANKFTLIVVGKSFVESNNSKIKNVRFLGTKSYEDLQTYYSHCDVCVLPFSHNQIAEYSQPLKVIESLSHGKINVCTNITEARLLNSKNPNVVYIANNHEHFIQLINKALKNKDDLVIQNQARELTKEYDWENQVDIFENAVEEFIRKNK